MQITDWMVATYDPKLLVVACNTATAVALDDLAGSVSTSR